MAATQKPVADSWPTWLRVWFWIQLVVITFDCAFVLLRPHSFPEGSLGAMFPAFHVYMTVDKVYADIADPYGWAQSVACLFENAILAFAMFVLHPKEQGKASAAIVPQKSDLLALIVTGMQFGKSVFKWFLDISGGFEHVAHNSPARLTQLYLIPNAIWLIGPLFVFAFFCRKILSAGAAPTKSA